MNAAYIFHAAACHENITTRAENKYTKNSAVELLQISA
jgi:hypothetical protein